MSKYLFFDIDGTLVGKNKQITKNNAFAIKKARDNGHKVFIATGRAPTTIHDAIWQLNVDGFICSAGSYIYINHELIYEHAIDPDLLKETIDLFENNQMHYTLECIDCLYESKGNQAFFERINKKRFKENLELLRYFMVNRSKQNRHPISEYHYDIPVCKLDFVSPGKKVLTIENELNKHFNVVYFREEDTFINGEIIIKDCTKAHGIQHVLDYYEASKEDSIAFGDTMNDYQMLEYAHTSVCYKDSEEKLKALCDYEFESPDNDGIYKVMKEMELI